MKHDGRRHRRGADQRQAERLGESARGGVSKREHHTANPEDHSGRGHDRQWPGSLPSDRSGDDDRGRNREHIDRLSETDRREAERSHMEEGAQCHQGEASAPGRIAEQGTELADGKLAFRPGHRASDGTMLVDGGDPERDRCGESCRDGQEDHRDRSRVAGSGNHAVETTLAGTRLTIMDSASDSQTEPNLRAPSAGGTRSRPRP